MANPGDGLLAFWLFVALAWDCIVWGLIGDLIVYHGHSAWWLLLAALLSAQSSLFKALRKRFEIPKDDDV